MPHQLDRRSFLKRTAPVGAVWSVAPWLQGLVACSQRGGQAETSRVRGYGPIGPTDVPQLALPAGFRCVVLSQSGDRMTNGSPTPNAFDGMAAFPLPNGNVRLIRNHEMRDTAATAAAFGDPARAYDPKGPGGTTSLEVRVRADGRPEVVKSFISLSGTHVNCAGGPTPWGSWLSCEETTEGMRQGRARPHGYVFEVAVKAENEVTATPYKAMGRFVHEATAVDGQGTVYLTEDRRIDPANKIPGSGFYRFLPTVPGKLSAGGRLQALAVRDRARYNTSVGQTAGAVLEATWVDVEDPDPAAADTDPSAVCRAAQTRGAAMFERLEGCWRGPGNSVFFHSTGGGEAGLGQVWQYRVVDASTGALVLVYESSTTDALDHPDNLTVSPRGGLLICEDGGGTQYLRGLTSGGEIFPFARNLYNGREFAGACFSPDGRMLFVNIQGGSTVGSAPPSFTFAIWGPWERGAL